MPQNVVFTLNRENKIQKNPKIDKNSEIKMLRKFLALSIMLLQLIKSSGFSSCLSLSPSPCVICFFCHLLHRFSFCLIFLLLLKFNISTSLLISSVTVVAIKPSFEAFELDHAAFALLLQINLFLSRKHTISVYILSHLFDSGISLWKYYLKGPLFVVRQFLTIKSPFKMMENAFYFVLKALFLLEIFTFLS